MALAHESERVALMNALALRDDCSFAGYFGMVAGYAVENGQIDNTRVNFIVQFVASQVDWDVPAGHSCRGRNTVTVCGCGEMLGTVSGAKVEFKPGPGWAWVGWDGELELDALETHQLGVDGKVAILVEDVLGCGTKLSGKSYKADGFDSTPGTVVTCTIIVDEASVFKGLTVGGGPVCGDQTKGTFSVAVLPSMSGSTPPVPDPLSSHTGKWRFTAAGQQKLNLG